MYERPYFQVLKARMDEPRRFIQVLFGPRQVGKTTLVNQLLTKSDVPYHSISADGVPNSNADWITLQWHTARAKFEQCESESFLLVIDEIQKISNWSEVIKKLWDEDTKRSRNIKVILLGSSRLLLQQGLTESLAGRFETIYMRHWSLEEMYQSFGLTPEQYVWFGGYPGSVSLIEDEPRWKKYIADSLIETSISKDILMLTRVDKPALMRRLFELGCTYSGQLISFTKLLGQLQDAGNTVTLSHYLSLLDAAGLLGGLDKYGREKIRQRASIPKFQVHNTALISAQRKETLKEIVQQPELWGRIVESCVGAHLLNFGLSENFKLFYWRERNDEVDFVLEKGGNVVGIEVKSGLTQKSAGINAFLKKINPNKMLLVGENGMPWKEFLLTNPASLF